MKIRPLGKRVLLRTIKMDQITTGGIHLPDVAEDKPVKGEVLSVGTEDTSIKVGETVMFGKHAGQNIELEEEKYLMINEGDVMAVLNA